MPLLQICQNVLAEVGWPVLSSVASNTDGTAKQIFAIANTELKRLSERHNWPHLETEYAFNTVAAQAQYPWPEDFRVPAQQSVFDASEYYQLRGSVSLQEWHYRKNGLLGNLGRRTFRTAYPLGVPGFEITPTPTSINSLVATYYSKEFATDETGDSIPVFAQDTDTSKVPEEYIELGIKWRFRRAKGLDFSVELAEYNDAVKTQFAKYLSQAEIPVGGRRWQDDYITNGYVPENGFGV